MLNATIYYQTITRDYSKTLSGTAAEPVVARETKYFLANISKVKTVDQLLHNSRLYNYVMKAYGLGDQLNSRGLVKKVLEGGSTSSSALANTLNDPRYLAMAKAFDFKANGTSTTSSQTAQQGTVNSYLEQTLEVDAGKQNPGTQKALYFKRMAPNIKDAYSILADKTLLSVVETTLGLPVTISLATIDAQAHEINSRYKVSDLQDPAKLQRFIERYTSTYDAQNWSPTSSTPTSALDVNTVGIGSDLLMSLSKLKLGGS
jgi:hypothetical protein